MPSRVVWVGDAPPIALERPFKTRDLQLDPRTLADAAAALAGARALVISCASVGVAGISSETRALVDEALRHGLRILVAPPMREVKAVADALVTDYFNPNRGALLNLSNPDALAERCARWEPGRPYSSAADLTGCDDCDREQMILVRRAFSDCRSASLSLLPGGHSARVYLVHAQLADSRVGPFPLPFFVKLDTRSKINRELENYGAFTTAFVPFYARPNLEQRRCLLGAKYGIIVGNFVEQSESLSEVVYAGRGYSAVHSLFEDALRGWRTQSNGKSPPQSIARSMGGGALFNQPPSPFLIQYANEARRLGNFSPPAEIARQLDTLPPIAHQRGTCHGDLHGENVRVRAGQSILIDFASVQEGPLVSDPAQLEVALAFGWKSPDVAGWTATMLEIYTPGNLATVPPPPDPSSPSASLRNGIRQIRRFGLGEQRSSGEYMSAVAVALLRKAAHPRDPAEDDIKRPLFLWLASRLSEHLTLGVT